MRSMLMAKLETLEGQPFEDFFVEMMCLADPGFFGVRARGSLGDFSADGLMINDRRLYACYGPQTVNENAAKRKIGKDLAGALAKRPGAFDTFVFVHPDHRGLDPVVSKALSSLRADHPDISFENFGFTQFYRTLGTLERFEIEELLGPFPTEEQVTGVALKDVMPLLDHLREERKPSNSIERLPVPSDKKIDYNGFSFDARYEMIRAMAYVPCVETYYTSCLDPMERDSVAAGFRERYLQLAAGIEDPDEILHQLRCHILGNKAAGISESLNALVVLMYFFGECDIFQVPPSSWPAVPEPR
jgi:C-terminal domain 10 of the ABC-three component (ABC-3C) systems